MLAVSDIERILNATLVYKVKSRENNFTLFTCKAMLAYLGGHKMAFTVRLAGGLGQETRRQEHKSGLGAAALTQGQMRPVETE